METEPQGEWSLHQIHLHLRGRGRRWRGVIREREEVERSDKGGVRRWRVIREREEVERSDKGGVRRWRGVIREEWGGGEE